MNCRGFTLLEVLVAFSLLSLATTGIVATQIRAAHLSAYQEHASRASLFAADILQRLQLNPSVDYRGLPVTRVFPVNCFASACSSPERAAYDIAMVYTMIGDELPGGSLAITSCDEAGGVCVRVGWSGQESLLECGETGRCQVEYALTI